MNSKNNNIGRTICKIRERQNVSRQSLSKGLCSQSNLFKIEIGKQIPDRLLFNTFLQRLGKSPANFLTTLKQGEYRYFKWKKDVLLAMEAARKDKLAKLLAQPAARDRTCNERLQEQFSEYMSGYLEQDEMRMRAAIKITVPDFDGNLNNEDFLSTVELNMILLYLELFKDLWGRELTVKRLEGLLFYVKEHVHDEEEQIKVYPKAVCLLAECLESAETDKRIYYCRQGLELLVKNFSLHCLPDVLKWLVKGLKEAGNPEAVRYEKQWRALEAVYQEMGISLYSKRTGLDVVCQEVYLLHEILLYSRREKGYTQEQASEGILAPENYSRIETGKREPRTKTYRALQNRLGIECGYYQSFLETDDYEVLENYRKIFLFSRLDSLGETEQLLETIKNKLDLKVTLNYQAIKDFECMVQVRKGSMSMQELVEQMTETLKMTVPKWEIGYKNHFFTKLELEMLAHIAIGYWRTGRKSEAIQILEDMWEFLRTSKVLPECRYQEALLILTNLINYLFELKEYDKVIQYADEQLYLSFICEKGDKIDISLTLKALSLYRKDEKYRKVCKEYYKWAFYITDLFKRTENHKIIMKRYEEEFGNDTDWY